MFDEILKLLAVRKQMIEVSGLESALSTPKLSDLKLIPTIYGWFQEVHSSAYSTASGNQSTLLRRQFVFIILYLYSPQKLVGGKMKDGLRVALSDVIGVSARTIISNDSGSLFFEYQTYVAFRTSVDQAYALISKKLEE